jgi:hypothetical protein
MGHVSGHGFAPKVVPAVTAGAYSAGDIVGGLLTFQVGEGNNSMVVVTGVEVAIKAAVTSALTLVLFDSDPTATTKTDNAAYSLAAADAFRVISVINFTTASALLTDHGTPNTYSVNGISIVCGTDRETKAVYGLLIDGTGWTLTSTSDVQVILRGLGC